MTTPPYSWEKRLLKLALPHTVFANVASAARFHAPSDLRSDFLHCSAITRENSRSFFVASGLLPEEKKRDIRALYAFCRHTDDLIDLEVPAQLSTFTAWRSGALTRGMKHTEPVLKAWLDVQNRHRIPRAYVEQFLNGVALDIQQQEYKTFEELALYCYGVASTVGLMSMCIIGFQDPAAVRYAIRLGIALQMTNILRDVAEDWALGRLYLPLDELHAFGLTKADIGNCIATGCYDDHWRTFMQFQIRRTYWLYENAKPGIALLHRDGQFATAAAATLYAGILEDIEAHDYDVFTRRAYVSDWKKMIRLPGIFLRTRKWAASV